MKVVLSGGGTGGHVNPALNIAKAIKKQDPQAEISFVGTKRGIESTLVPKAGYQIDFVQVQGFRRKMNLKGLKENCKALYRAVSSVHQAKKILKVRQPDVVVGTGGYVSWPTVKAASKLGIPCLIHEQNTFPGVTTKKLSKLANVVCISFEGSEKFFPKEAANKLMLTGNPIHVDHITRAEAREKLGIGEDELYVLSFGGSMGAKRVNELCFDLMEQYTVPAAIRHDHAVGRVEFEHFSALAKETGLDKQKNLTIAEYFYDMPYRQAAADVIVCRAGAMTLAELAVRGKAAILIPSPNVTGNHQYINAKALADKKAALLIPEAELDGETLTCAINELLNNDAERFRMGEAIRCFSRPEAGRLIFEDVCYLLKNQNNG